MKKLLISILILLPIIASAQFSGHRKSEFLVKGHTANTTTAEAGAVKSGGTGTAADTLLQIIGTGIDTSLVYEAWPYMSMQVFLTSFAAGDAESTSVKFRIRMASETEYAPGVMPRAFSQYSTIDSVTVTGLNATFHVLTDGSPAYPNAHYFYLEAVGASALNDSTRARVKFQSWDTLPK